MQVLEYLKHGDRKGIHYRENEAKMNQEDGSCQMFLDIEKSFHG